MILNEFERKTKTMGMGSILWGSLFIPCSDGWTSADIDSIKILNQDHNL